MNLVTPISCPDCGGKLGAGAIKCRCGWKLTVDGLVQQEKRIPCALKHMCDRPAKVSVMVAGNRLNACMQCYGDHRTDELKAYDATKTAEDRAANRERLLKVLKMGSGR